MAESRKIIRVFLASPGDLSDERRMIKQVVDELNQLWFSFHGYQVELVGWELTVSGLGRPQELINQDLDTCEYFLGLLYKRWGTPPDKRGKFTSGFEEEFTRSVKRYKATRKPEISLYFKVIDSADRQDPGEQLKRVLQFKKGIVEGKELLYEEFSTVEEFQQKIRRCITNYVQRLIARERPDSDKGSQIDVEKRSQSRSLREGASQNPLSNEGALFLRNLIAKIEGNDSVDSLSHVEVARFRLLSSVVTAVRSEHITLGVHDANILFEVRHELNFGTVERSGLVKAGFAHYEHDNVPIWHWLTSLSDKELLAFRTVVGTSEEIKVGALMVMCDVAEPLPTSLQLPRTVFLDLWFEKDAPASRKIAALRCLAESGVLDDLVTIKLELEKNDYQTSRLAVETIIRIQLRESRQKAYEALLELQPENIDKRVSAALFSNDSSLTNDELRSGLGHRCVEVKLATLKLLVARGAMDTETAGRLLSDANRRVRLEAMTFLSARGRVFVETDARKLLVEATTYGNLFSSTSNQPSEELLIEFRNRQRKATEDRILEESLGSSVFNREEEFVLAERHFAKYAPQLRATVSNFYKDEFEKALERDFKDIPDHEIARRTRDLEDFIRKEHTRAGLDIICRQGDAREIALVRRVISSGFVGFSFDDVEYFRRYGEWVDVSLLIKSVDQPIARLGNVAPLSALLMTDYTKYRAVAKSICALARERLNELLDMQMPESLRAYVILNIPTAAFPALEDQALMRLFSSDDGSVRKASALRCVSGLARNRLTKLLDSYLSNDDYHYYNVIKWLDLGVSLPKQRAKAVVQRVINRTWPE